MCNILITDGAAAALVLDVVMHFEKVFLSAFWSGDALLDEAAQPLTVDEIRRVE